MCDGFKVLKTSLKSILKNDLAVSLALRSAIYRTNKIVIDALQMLKLYCLFLFEKNLPFPTIDAKLIRDLMSLVSVKSSNRGVKAKIQDNIIRFYKVISGLVEIPQNNSDYLNQILNCEADTIVTCIHTNIKEHYLGHLDRFIKLRLRYKEKIEKINGMKISK